MPKLSQFRTEWLVPAPFTVLTVVDAPCSTFVALPWIGCSPVSCATAIAGAKHPASASTIPAGRWPATGGEAAVRGNGTREWDLQPMLHLLEVTYSPCNSKCMGRGAFCER